MIPHGMMKTSPTPAMVARLHRWCIEWQLDRALAATVKASPSPGESNDGWGTDLTRPTADLMAGSLALLPPIEGDTGTAPPLYVMLINDPANGGLLVIPFSRFAEPATLGELLGEQKPHALRVLALWNARTLARPAHLRGWTLGTVTATEIERVTRAYRSVKATGSLPSEMKGAGGPPLSHPDDPRRLYLREARRLLNRYLGQPDTHQFRYPQPESNLDALPRAAEERGKYGADGDATT